MSELINNLWFVDEKTGDIVVGPLPVMSLQSATGDRME